MARLASRSLGVPLAVAGVALLGLTPMIDSGFAYADSLTGTAAATDPDIGLIMGGSRNHLPGDVSRRAGHPEDLYPLTGGHSLPLDTSVSEGVTIVNNSIESNIPAGDVSTVFGYSQSGIISSLEMEQLSISRRPGCRIWSPTTSTALCKNSSLSPPEISPCPCLVVCFRCWDWKTC